ncbi:Protein of uncharacterised function (DUF2570) [Serratia proteamaculans]|uniref:hypothetical protein n=1 Tax=Serratia proteamaculans TaxID=28151 RepID=UPI002178BCBA|nr:hypothetical protein [Serratia proteamaculans]CAI0825285.1 Protein of uncharacterised function (DUF2570) [Serratia proteamaculans]CAI1612536.1 Protein of uncharacterised function (DUF2570) [Serratia proteamaculans]
MNRYWVLVSIFVACLAGGLIWSANHYNSKYQEARRQVEKQKNALAQQSGLIATMQEQDARNRKLMAEQQQREQQLRQRGEIYQRKYQDAIKNDECARRVAPGAVLDLLRGTDTTAAGTDRPASS